MTPSLETRARTPAERALSASEQRYRQIVETTVEGVWTLDAKGHTTFVNPALSRMLGFELEEVAGQPATLLLPASEWRRFGRLRDTVKTGESVHTESTLRRRDGSLMSAAIVATPTRDDEDRVEGALVMVTDHTASREAQARLGETRNFLEAITRRMAEGLVALDGKGLVTYMNAAAEEMLARPARELMGHDFHAATHHSERNGCTLEDCGLLRAPTAAEHLRVETDVFCRRDESELTVTFSAAPLIVSGEHQGAVIVFSDISDRTVREQREQDEIETLGWIARIREAIVEDRLVLHGQPIIDLSSGATVQTELLLRMRERDGTIVGPGVFLPFAERYGFMKEIDLWVIRHAIELAAGGGHYEINLSAQSIGEFDVLYAIERELERTGAEASHLVFEITETALMEDADRARRFAEELTRIGCRFALDDFGTGYGSFTYLKHLPVELLKIDMEFVRDLVDDPASEHVVKAIVNLGAGFGQTTIAEGVEDQQTLDKLRELGVDQAQGFHIGRPAEILWPDGQR